MSASFPTRRLRRLRKNEKMRNLVQEVLFSTNDLICPVFVQEDLKEKSFVKSMPDIVRLPLSEVTKEILTAFRYHPKGRGGRGMELLKKYANN